MAAEGRDCIANVDFPFSFSFVCSFAFINVSDIFQMK